MYLFVGTIHLWYDDSKENPEVEIPLPIMCNKASRRKEDRIKRRRDKKEKVHFF